MMVLILLLAAAAAAAEPLFPLVDTGGRQFISSVEGPRKASSGGAVSGSYHAGTDIACRVGTPVVAVEDGLVIVCAYGDPILGRYMVLRTESGYNVLYGHLSVTKYPRGSQVRRGTVIALTGNTGKTTGPHLHFQVLVPWDEYYRAEPYRSDPPDDWRWRK